MPYSNTVTLTGTFSGGAINPSLSIPAITTTAQSIEQVTTLSSGANTISVPSGSTSAIIVPPSGNTVGITLKGVTGDTGVALYPSTPALIPIASGVSSFVLTAASTVQVCLVFF